MLTKIKLLNEYNFFKKKAIKAYKNDEIDKCLDIIQYSAYLAWQYPILFNFIDGDFERTLDGIAKKIAIPNTEPGIEKRAVMYSGQVIDCGALTEQYLYFLAEHDYKVLLIAPSKENTQHGPDTLKYVANHSNMELFIPASEKTADRIKEISGKIAEFKPSLAFLHFLPDDVIGYCSFTGMNQLKRYFIVHNDHTFWLGKGCSDFFIEFRKFGYLLASQRRKIPFSQLYLLPYYPINNKLPFEGLPFDRTGKVVGISGAALYKYLMDADLKYLRAIRQLLQTHPDFIFCICGWGKQADVEKILAVFDEPGVKERVYFLGRRLDFYAVIGQVDILFESYPFKGGLTLGFAVEQGKAAIGMGNSKNASGNTQDYFGLKDYTEPMDIPTFLSEGANLIESKEARIRNNAQLAANRFNKNDFSEGLEKIISGKDVALYTPKFTDPMTLDDEYFLNEYINLPHAERGFYRYQLNLKKYLGLPHLVKTSISYVFARLKDR